MLETHISYVFLIGDRAYKLKKPMNLGFLDFSTREAREAACRREIELNSPLAPDVYLGIATVAMDDGAPVDHMVVMRRLPEERRLAGLLRRGTDVTTELREVARVVAAFHRNADHSSAVSAAATWQAVQGNWDVNFTQMLPFVGSALDADEFGQVGDLAHAYLAGRARLFEQRLATGQARAGHGDLLAQDIFLLDDGPRIIDCIEFDDLLRYGDVLLDVAFLAMDLERLGFRAAAAGFLGAYRDFWGADWPASLEHHYIAYRAQVRTKIACLRYAQGDHDALAEARQLQTLCLNHLNASEVHLVLVGGLPGSGKSTLARGLASHSGWTLLRSDGIRKELSGLPELARASAAYGEGLYRQERRDSTYEALIKRAHSALEMGQSVVLDASWNDVRWRQAATRVAAETHSRLVQLMCIPPEEVSIERIAERRERGGDPSDVTPDLLPQLRKAFHEWPEATAINTTGPIEDTLRHALDRIATADR